MDIILITCDKEKVNDMKLHMLMLMNAWMMLVLMECKCQMQCLTLGCYIRRLSVHDLEAATSIPQHFGEPLRADDWVGHEWVSS